MKALGKKPPECEEGTEDYSSGNHKIKGEKSSSCCSCEEYCCTTRAEEHYRQSLIEAADELDNMTTPCKEYNKWQDALVKKLRISAGKVK
jgi:hypothetical protein